jgi:hypothetical protein
MINRTIQLEDITAMPGANAAGQFVINAPAWLRYKDITLKLANSANTTFASSSITAIEVRLGKGIQRRCTGVQLDATNALNGASYASQAYGTSGTDYERHLKLYMEEPWRTRTRNNSVDPNALGWKTGWAGQNNSLQIVVSVAALGSGVSPVITAEAMVSDDDDGKPNPIIRWNQDNATPNGSLVSVANLANGLKNDDRIVQLSVFDGASTAGVISTIRLELGPVVIKQDQRLRALTTELITAGMAPATANAIANAAHLVFDKNDSLDDSIPVGFISSLLKLTYSTSAVGAVPYITQVLGSPATS